MIEIFALYKLCGLLGRRLRDKGHPTVRYQLLLIFGWFFGELLGGFVGALITILTGGSGDGLTPLVYICALIFAAGAVAGVFLIARLLPDRIAPPAAFPVEPLAAPVVAPEALAPEVPAEQVS